MSKAVAATSKDVRKGRYLCRRWGRNTPQSQSERNNKRKRGQIKQRSDCLSPWVHTFGACCTSTRGRL